MIPALEDADDHNEPKASPLLVFGVAAAGLLLEKEFDEDTDGREVAGVDTLAWEDD